jgi:hypothetical protein
VQQLYLYDWYLLKLREILYLVRRLRKFYKFCVAVATEISNWELNVTCMDAGSVADVVILKLKWRSEGNGSVIIVDRRDAGCLTKNCRMLCFKLTL